MRSHRVPEAGVGVGYVPVVARGSQSVARCTRIRS